MAASTASKWISVPPRRVCSPLTAYLFGRLESLIDTLDPKGLHARYVNTLAGTHASASYEIIRDNRAYGRTLLTLRILVQNRRKEKTPILVFGARAQVLIKVSSTDAVQRGRTEADNMVVFIKDGRVLPRMTSVIDAVADMICV